MIDRCSVAFPVQHQRLPTVTKIVRIRGRGIDLLQAAFSRHNQSHDAGHAPAQTVHLLIVPCTSDPPVHTRSSLRKLRGSRRAVESPGNGSPGSSSPPSALPSASDRNKSPPPPVRPYAYTPSCCVPKSRTRRPSRPTSALRPNPSFQDPLTTWTTRSRAGRQSTSLGNAGPQERRAGSGRWTISRALEP